MLVELTEQEERMLRILLDLCAADQRETEQGYRRQVSEHLHDHIPAMMLDDYNFQPEERFVMREVLDKIGGPIDPFDLATAMDMSYFYADIRKRMKAAGVN